MVTDLDINFINILEEIFDTIFILHVMEHDKSHT